MIQELLKKEEGKTLEFKENSNSLSSIIKTIVAFANTAGGTIIVGVQDKTKNIVGLIDPLEDEMRIINKVSDSITPFLRPNLEIQSYRNKALILIQVPYAVGPYYVKTSAETMLAYVRFGSTNRIADDDTLLTMKSLAKNITFDESPCPQASIKDLDWHGVENCFSSSNKHITKNKAKNIGLITSFSGSEIPSNGGILLFGKNRSHIFPDAIIRCVRFLGTTKENSIDHLEVNKYLPDAIDDVLYFIKKNTFTKTKIGPKRRIDQPQYPLIAIREAIINAVAHTDYSIKGSSIIVAIFDDRLEITNPGTIPYGLSLEDALAGSSRVRNRVIARTFHSLNLIEQWGSGLQKIIQSCIKNGLNAPKFEEIGAQFRVSIFSAQVKKIIIKKWQKNFLDHLHAVGELSAHDAAKFWHIDVRSARRRLKQLLTDGVITKIETSKHDPYGRYVACEK
ncbi:MAG: ATP-binding protein [bacterium]